MDANGESVKVRKIKFFLRMILFIGMILICGRLHEEPLPLSFPQLRPLAGKKIQNHPAQKRSAKISGHYSFEWMDQKIQKSRGRIAGCMLRNPNFGSVRSKMTLDWSSTGAIERVKIIPDPGSSVKECITDLVVEWQLPVHPGLQPFSYSVVLVPSH